MTRLNPTSDVDMFPMAVPLPVELSAVEVCERLAARPHVIFFDSAGDFGELGRYSFVAADPVEWIEASSDKGDPLGHIASRLRQFPSPTRADLPPFQGGVAGLFGYDLNRTLEKLPRPRRIDLPIPDLAVGIYDVVVAFDHLTGQSWIVSQGYPESNPVIRRERARCRAAEMQSWLSGPVKNKGLSKNLRPPHPALSPEYGGEGSWSNPIVDVRELAPQVDVGLGAITSNLTADDYRKMIERAVEYIHAGDVFQVNLAQRLLVAARSDSVSLYLKLREANPAPYAGYLDLGNAQICSSSPECFLQLRGRQAQTRPIKGTRGRSSYPEADLFAGDELQLSDKDRAENVMIVDLMRNDFSRVCEDRSVHVAELCRVETYAHVKHLVSTVKGTLAAGATSLELLRACFPGGSITGAPKIRAMEIIAELEPTARGAYCGSLAYLGFDGQMDSSILIRTITASGGWWQLPVGGGIVAQSVPADEYRETWFKARGLLRALELC